MSKIIILAGILFLTSCATVRDSATLVLDYEAFGPPVVAHEVIGMDWWQWMKHGDSRPGPYPIKVVVYRDIPLAEVEKRYPVNPELEQDYRYLEYSRAKQYLDKLIEENVIESLTAELVKTREEIEAGFGPASAAPAY